MFLNKRLFSATLAVATLLLFSLLSLHKRVDHVAVNKTPHFVTKERSGKDVKKLEFVKQMMRHAWNGYKTHAWGTDDLCPLTKKGHNWELKTMLYTPIDSLDTLWIMGMMPEYIEAKNLILNTLDFSQIDSYVNVFETTIRGLGGLLAAYELEGDARILKKAIDLADRLLHAWKQNTFPSNRLNLKTLDSLTTQVSIATAGTLQLEFQYLADITRNDTYRKLPMETFKKILTMNKKIPGLYPKFIDTYSERFSMFYEYGLGGESDSFYEYILKLWISAKDVKLRDYYQEAAEAISEHMVLMSNNSKWAYVPDYRPTFGSNQKFGQGSFHHLTCFAGGMFSTGAMLNRNGNRKKHMEIASKITETCYEMYKNGPTGVGAETASFMPSGTDFNILVGKSYELRPETVESIFYMWRYTHDPKYREWGWDIAQRIEKVCKAESGYHAIDNFGSPKDGQESFFLAETLKYLYLLFEEDHIISLDEYVFNTEAHPFSIRGFGKRRHSPHSSIL